MPEGGQGREGGVKPRLIKIKASAGSGKTRALSIRYISLLSQLSSRGEFSPEALGSIVAITFTNKAAAEMKERILTMLKEAALGCCSDDVPVDAQDADRWVSCIIEGYSWFQVRTIDSLLFTFLRALSFELDIAESTEVVFDKEYLFNLAFDRFVDDFHKYRPILEKALRNYLEMDRKGGFYPEKGLRKRLFELFDTMGMAKVRSWNGKVDVEAVEESFHRALKEFADALEPYIDVLKKDFYRLVFVKADIDSFLKSKLVDKELSYLFKKGSLEKVPSLERERLENLYSGLLDSIGRYKDELAKLCYARASGYAEVLNLLVDVFGEVAEELGVVAGGEHWTHVVGEKLREEGVVPLVYAYLGSRFLHFLFDEFQDTSRGQLDTLRPVLDDLAAKGGTLFFVGDPKQAIYGWRGGDWRLFDELHFESIGADEVKEIYLDVNYRSVRGLVEFFNRTFSRLSHFQNVSGFLRQRYGFSQEVADELARDVSVIFSNVEQKAFVDGDGELLIYSCSGSSDELDENVAGRLVKLVKERWEGRKKEETFAVLVRRRDDAVKVSQWLLSSGIPVVTERSLSLGVSPTVRGLVAFLKYVHSGSDVSLYGLLSSGVLPPDRESPGLNWRLAKEKVDRLIGEVEGWSSKNSPYELVVAFMDRVGLWDRLDNGDLRHESPFVERFLEGLYTFTINEGPFLGRFLDFMEERGWEIGVGLPEGVDAVNVMTIHKAKGLQFDRVFIPFTNWTVVDSTPIVIDGEGHLVVLGSESKYSEHLSRMREMEWGKVLLENLNLFYVAVTRARRGLYLFITHPEKGQRKPISYWVEELIRGAGVEVEEC